jgi:hypothetical protein
MTTKPKTRKAPAARRKSNVVPFPKTVDPEHREDIEVAQSLFAAMDNIIMRGYRKSLAKAEVKASLGDSDAKDDVEFFRLSIARRYSITLGSSSPRPDTLTRFDTGHMRNRSFGAGRNSSTPALPDSHVSIA